MQASHPPRTLLLQGARDVSCKWSPTVLLSCSFLAVRVAAQCLMRWLACEPSNIGKGSHRLHCYSRCIDANLVARLQGLVAEGSELERRIGSPAMLSTLAGLGVLSQSIYGE
jgi:hypothetical protein